MSKITQRSINERFIKFIDTLIEKGIVKNDADFARSININPGQLSDIRNNHGKNATSPMLLSTLLVYKTIDWLVEDLSLLNEIISKNSNPDTQRKVRELEAYKKYAEKELEAKQKAMEAREAEMEYLKQKFSNGDAPNSE